MHSPVPSTEIIEALIHIRDLFRRIKPSSAREERASERREAATKDLLSNLPRVNEHPTLRTLLEIAEISSLTLEGAHRLFGYELARDSRIRSRFEMVDARTYSSPIPSNVIPADRFAA